MCYYIDSYKNNPQRKELFMNNLVNVIKTKENVQIVEVDGYLTSLDLNSEEVFVEIAWLRHVRESSEYKDTTKELESFFKSGYRYINIDITEYKEDFGSLYDVEVRLFDGEYRTGNFMVSSLDVNYLKFVTCDFILNDFKCKSFIVDATNDFIIINFAGYMGYISLNDINLFTFQRIIEDFYRAAEKHSKGRYSDLLLSTEKKLRLEYPYITITLDEFNKYEHSYLDYYLCVRYYKNGFKSTLIAINKCCLNYLYEFVKYLLLAFECKNTIDYENEEFEYED